MEPPWPLQADGVPSHTGRVILDRHRLEAARTKAVSALLAARVPGGHWEGELSSSALSTATAVTALAIHARAGDSDGSAAQTVRTGQLDPGSVQRAIAAGVRWLAQNANPDGGWGDTVVSHSNISTTILCWAAFGAVPGAEARYRPVMDRVEAWLRQHAGGTRPDQFVPAIIRRYGKDRTFSVPILTLCALAGRLGEGAQAWEYVGQLPFELAACPHSWFAALKLPVVSYALPALIAIGQARHFHLPTRNPIARVARHWTRARTLRILEAIQPVSGGFLEATPLTSFVGMSLAGSGLAGHPCAQRCMEFLLKSQRPDGSWPIDTNLATWVTTLAVGALDGTEEPGLGASDGARILAWLTQQQHRVEHPYSHAAPGGWAWTDLSGGVPDADDTAGALLALRKMTASWNLSCDPALLATGVRLGIGWLLDLQNRDGGMPTFCRGWGTLPFDRSSADITAHAVRAWIAWRPELPLALQTRVDKGLVAAVGFLVQTQLRDGAWSPLWFGNQHVADERNLTYGTARVVRALVDVGRARGADGVLHPLQRGVEWMLRAQLADGSWGGGVGGRPSIEETAVAMEALAALACADLLPPPEWKRLVAAVERAALWLVERVERDEWQAPAPIGFYFAKLWYFERLYPIIFAVAALNGAGRLHSGAMTAQNSTVPAGV